MKPIALSIEEAAAHLSIGKTKLYSLIGSGEIPAKKLGNNRSPLRLNPIVRTSRHNLKSKLRGKLPLSV